MLTHSAPPVQPNASELYRPARCNLLFAGDPRLGYEAYSGGVRQQLWRQWHANPNASAARMCVQRGARDEAFHDAKFALAVSGDGWGNRFMKGALLGAVPLVAAPLVVQPHEYVLPLPRFSRRLEFEQLPTLAEYTAAVGADELAALRAALHRARDAFVWGWGGLAYNFTVLALCQRARELRGALRAGPHASCAPLAAALPEADAATADEAREPEWFGEPLTAAVRRAKAHRRQAMTRLSRDARLKV